MPPPLPPHAEARVKPKKEALLCYTEVALLGLKNEVLVIYILADDLTGATDTGVQFAKQGYRTLVLLVTESAPWKLPHFERPTAGIEVLVLDTETRHLDPSSAQPRIRFILQYLAPAPEDIIYQKIDSTLRGNPGAEIDECLRTLRKDICLFAPAFPAMKRITVAGCLLVDNQPLGQTAYYTGNLAPQEASYISNLLKQQTSLPIIRLDLSDVIKGPRIITERLRRATQAGDRIIVADAINDMHLYHLLVGGRAYGSTMLYAGSAGLANALAEVHCAQFPPVSSAVTPLSKRSGPLVIVNGSRRTLARQQVDYLKARIDVVDVALNVEQLCTHRESYIAQQIARVAQALFARHHVIIRPDPRDLDEQRQQAILQTGQLDRRQLETLIQSSIGELVSRIIEQTGVSWLLVIGGDTAAGVCNAAGIYQLQVRQEVLPGVPLCVGTSLDGRELTLITKAGGFGDETTLSAIVNTFK